MIQDTQMYRNTCGDNEMMVKCTYCILQLYCLCLTKNPLLINKTQPNACVY